MDSVYMMLNGKYCRFQGVQSCEGIKIECELWNKCNKVYNGEIYDKSILQNETIYFAD